MNRELIVFTEKGKSIVDSREVAVLIERNHFDLLRDIRKYCSYLTESNFAVSEFFVETTYIDSTGRELPSFLLTKKRL